MIPNIIEDINPPVLGAIKLAIEPVMSPKTIQYNMLIQSPPIYYHE